MSSHSGLGLDDDYVFVTDEKSHVWGLRDNRASLWWQRELENRALTSPRRFADYVVVGDIEGQSIGSTSMTVAWLDARVGSSPRTCSVVGDGLVYIFLPTGHYRFRAATE